MTNAIVKAGERMYNIKLITIALVISSFVFLGCIQPPAPAVTPAPTAAPTVTETVKPTAVPTTPSPTPTPLREQAVYRSEVDDVYGFYRVLALNTTKPAPYDNLTLTIYVGDKVRWISDSTDYTITITSEQGLWDNTSAKLRWNEAEFAYTFNQTGTYGVYVREFPKIRHQKIIVKP